jgi:prepilin-type N-terminal cleavage/methylation domain-containing protein
LLFLAQWLCANANGERSTGYCFAMNCYSIGRRVAGFSLIEIAIVLIIISVLMAIVAVPIATQVNQRRIEETTKQLEVIKEAVIGFASAKGRLPCPAIDNGTFNSAGQEGFCTLAAGGCTPTTIEQAHGRCVANTGFLPAVTLGVTPVEAGGFALDAWGLPQNRIRYAVANPTIVAGTPATCATSVTNVFTSSGATNMRSATMACLAENAVTLLTVCSVRPTGAAGAASGCTAPLVTKAPFVVLSLGKNASTGGTGPDESHNVDGDSYFVFHTATPSGSPAGEFDDIVTWGSLNTLFARMVQAGKLP